MTNIANICSFPKRHIHCHQHMMKSYKTVTSLSARKVPSNEYRNWMSEIEREKEMEEKSGMDV